jgi:hypothetical protein
MGCLVTVLKGETVKELQVIRQSHRWGALVSTEAHESVERCRKVTITKGWKCRSKRRLVEALSLVLHQNRASKECHCRRGRAARDEEILEVHREDRALINMAKSALKDCQLQEDGGAEAPPWLCTGRQCVVGELAEDARGVSEAMARCKSCKPKRGIFGKSRQPKRGSSQAQSAASHAAMSTWIADAGDRLPDQLTRHVRKRSSSSTVEKTRAGGSQISRTRYVDDRGDVVRKLLVTVSGRTEAERDHFIRVTTGEVAVRDGLNQWSLEHKPPDDARVSVGLQKGTLVFETINKILRRATWIRDRRRGDSCILMVHQSMRDLRSEFLVQVARSRSSTDDCHIQTILEWMCVLQRNAEPNLNMVVQSRPTCTR